MKQAIQFVGSSVGKKIIVAVTGLCLMLFITGHLLGNLQFFLPPEYINAYAHKLQSLGPFLWVIRAGLLGIFGVHVVATVMLTAENRRARPQRYAAAGYRKSTAASRTMVVSGLIILCFVVFHLLHYTVRVVPGHKYNDAIVMADGTERPAEVPLVKGGKPVVEDGKPVMTHDVHSMMVAGFSRWTISAFYVVGMGLLFMHLSHGAASFFQTLGLRSEPLAAGLAAGGRAFSWFVFLGYISIPLSVLLGIVR